MSDLSFDHTGGAASSLMQDIARATSHPIHFNDIMDMLFKKMNDQSWRQVYKALQLAEYIIKNGSERAVSTCIDRIYDFKALRKFHYIDEKGKDQGINGTLLITIKGEMNVCSEESG